MKDSAAHPPIWAAAQTKKPDQNDPALKAKLKIDFRVRTQAQAYPEEYSRQALVERIPILLKY